MIALLWGTASRSNIESNIEILQCLQSKILRIVVDAPWYVTNRTLHKDLEVTTIKQEIKKAFEKHKTRLQSHPNELVITLMNKSNYNRRLKRKVPQDLIL